MSTDGKYGFADRNLIHKSVFHLVDYHKTVSLEEFNRELKDLKLIRPLVKKSRPLPSTSSHGGGGGGGGGVDAMRLGSETIHDDKATIEMDNDPDPKLAAQLLQVHAKWLVKQNDHEEKYEEHGEMMSRLQDQKQALDAFRQTVMIYEHQVIWGAS